MQRRIKIQEEEYEINEYNWKIMLLINIKRCHHCEHISLEVSVYG